jgi:hypothetical protein
MTRYSFTNNKKKKIQTNKTSVTSRKIQKSKLKNKTTIKKSITPKTELEKLIEKAKKSTKKSELMDLYKKINIKYDSAGVELQGKYYNHVMNIYKRLSKLK